jgi:hypothetical protein
MGALDDFLLGGNDELDATFGTVTMTCAGQSFAVVFNDAREGQEGALGGLEGDIQATVTAQPSDVSSPYSLLEKRCVISGRNYRIADITVGNIAVHFALAATNEAR